MTIFSRWVVTVMISATALNPLASASSLSPGAVILQNEMVQFRAAVDRGIDPEAALSTFARNLDDQRIGVQDFEQYLKSQMTTREFATFQEQLNAEMSGIDPTQLTREEIADVVTQILPLVGKSGLAWSSCTIREDIGIGIMGIGLVSVLYGFILSPHAHGHDETANRVGYAVWGGAGFFAGGVMLASYAGCSSR